MYDCPNFKRCSAPLCPKDPDIDKRIWFTSEGICSKHEFSKLKFIKTQRKLKRKKAPGFFVFEMLNRNVVIRKGVQGLNPDSKKKNIKRQIEDWISKRKEIPELTEEQKKVLIERMKAKKR